MSHLSAPDDGFEASGHSRAWPFGLRALFLFSFLYLVLSGCFWLFAFADKALALVARPFMAIWRPLVQWIATHIFGWGGAVAPSFVHDTRYLYALLTCLLVFSAVGAMVWSIAAGKRTEFRWLHSWLRVFVRYVLAYLMLHYGMDKVFFLQFPAPSLARLIEPFGDYSPSSLMWAFIGSSVPYTLFGGLAEISGAMLLLFRRTTTLGALITFAVMFNVTVMDFSYDVSVKMFSLNLLLMALFLILPDTKRLVDFFILNRGTKAIRSDELIDGKRGRLFACISKVALILYLIVPLTIRDWRSYRMTGAGAARPSLYGLYEVDEYAAGGKVQEPLLTDAQRWRYVIVEAPNVLTVKRMDESVENFPAVYDAGLHKLVVNRPGGGSKGDSLALTQQDVGHFRVEGFLDGVAIAATLHRIDRSSFPLVGRGFHWINETSYIR